MKKFLLAVLIMIIAVPAFAKDPKETVEYWQDLMINIGYDKAADEADKALKKCMNSEYTYFIVPVGSKEWNICCASCAAFNYFYGFTTFEAVNKLMIKCQEKKGDCY